MIALIGRLPYILVGVCLALLGALGPWVLWEGTRAGLMNLGVGGYSGTITVTHCEPTEHDRLCHGSFQPDDPASAAAFAGNEYALQILFDNSQPGDTHRAHLWSPDEANAYGGGDWGWLIPLLLGLGLVGMDLGALWRLFNGVYQRITGHPIIKPAPKQAPAPKRDWYLSKRDR